MSDSSFFPNKEAELLAMKKQQAKLAKKLFPIEPLEPLPPWASPQEIEGKKENLQKEMETSQQNHQQLLETKIQERKFYFQVQHNETLQKEAQLKERAKTLSPADSFEEEKKLIKENSQRIADEAQRIAGLIQQREQFFKKGDH